MESMRLSTKEKKEIISKIKENTNACLQNRKHANYFVDILGFSENYGKEDAVIQACIRSFHKIFSRYIEAGEMFLEAPLSGDETGLSKEEQYKVWLCQQYQTVIDKLLDSLHEHSSNTQELALSTLMKFVACEGSHPLRKIKGKQLCFPAQMFQKILKVIVSETTDFQPLLLRFQEYLEYDDVRFYTLKFLLSCCQEKQDQAASEILLNNVFALLENITIATPDGDTYSNFLSNLPDQGQKILLPHEHKKTFTSVWIEFLRFKLPTSLYRKVLVILHEKVMPYMTSPLMLADFLTDSYNIGGAISLLALNGLFILVHRYNLDYPDFFTKLYALFESSVFHVKYRSRFFHLSDLFLSSTNSLGTQECFRLSHGVRAIGVRAIEVLLYIPGLKHKTRATGFENKHLPAYLVAAFAKRLARISLTAPPTGMLIAVPFIYNLVNRHPNCKQLIDRQGDITDCLNDPYDVTETDPAKCRALESSLWEFKTLQSHYHPEVSKVSQKINDTVPTQETDLSELLDVTENDLFDKEPKKKFKSAAVTFDPPKGLLSAREDRLSLCWTLT